MLVPEREDRLRSVPFLVSTHRDLAGLETEWTSRARGELERGGLFPSPSPFSSFVRSYKYARRKIKIQCECEALVTIFKIVKIVKFSRLWDCKIRITFRGFCLFISGRFLTSMRGGILSVLQTHSEMFRVFLGVFRVFGVFVMFRDVPVFRVLAFLKILHAERKASRVACSICKASVRFEDLSVDLLIAWLIQ